MSLIDLSIMFNKDGSGSSAVPTNNLIFRQLFSCVIFIYDLFFIPNENSDVSLLCPAISISSLSTSMEISESLNFSASDANTRAKTFGVENCLDARLRTSFA